MSTKLQPPPLQVPISVKTGELTFSWASWFRDLFQRLGEQVASSNSELQTSQTTTAGNVTTLQAQMTAANTTLATLTSTSNGLQAQINGLSQGRDL